MINCYPASPTEKPKDLDVTGLDALVYYLTAIPVTLYLDRLNGRQEDIFDLSPVQYALQYDVKSGREERKAPLMGDWERLYGTMAQTLASSATSGYYGLSDVETSGSPPTPAYLVRLYILALLIVMLAVCPVLAGAWVLRNAFAHIPLRRATVLTTATAMRGIGWDATLYGGCVSSDRELRRKYEGVRVRFGVDFTMPSHVGFAEDVGPIGWNECYAGVSDELK